MATVNIKRPSTCITTEPDFTAISDTTRNVVLLAANANRLSARIVNCGGQGIPIREGGTAAPLSVFTDITPVNCLLSGSGRKNKVRFATTCTFTAAPTYLRPVGISTAALAATTAVAPFSMTFDEDGGLVAAPGTALQLCGNAAIAMVASVAITGLEIPLPPGWDG